MYKRHIAIKRVVDIHEVGDKAIEKKNVKYGLRVQDDFKTKNP